MGKKLTYEFVKEQIEKEGYKLLSNEYINSTSKIKIQCLKCDHEYKVTWNNFRGGNVKKGSRCPKCSVKKRVKKSMLSSEFVKKEFKKENITLIGRFNGTNKPVLVKCDICDHEYKVRFNHFKNGSGCPKCYRNKNKGENHSSWKGGYHSKNIPLYDTYAHQISYTEEVRRNKEDKNIIEVKCTYCGKWYILTATNMKDRIRALNENGYGEVRLYCSNECKKECPIFSKIKYSAEETNTKQYSREV